MRSLLRNSLVLILCVLGAAVWSSAAQAACANPAGNEGRLIYNTTTQQFQYCDGTDWIAMNPPGSGSGGCANPAMVEGQINYNPDYRVLQGCAGNIWKAMGPIGGTSGGGSGGGDYTKIFAGGFNTCGLKADGSLWCWTNDGSGQLGNGDPMENSTAPVEVIGGPWKKASIGGVASVCAIKADDSMWCWGDANFGILGNGLATGNQSSPYAVSGGGTWSDISLAYFQACGIKTDGTLWCWGTDQNGALGNGAAGNSNVPDQESTGATDWAQVAAGGSFTCAIKTDGTLWCWGAGANGRLGNGGTADQPSPVQESTGATDWAQVAAGGGFTCAVKTDGTLWCWGNASDGMGDQLNPNQEATAATDWARVEASDNWYQHACALKTDGSLWCWGANSYGELGDGTTTNSNSIVAALPGSAWTDFDIGSGHTCGIKTDGSRWCWGENGQGQLGSSSTSGNHDAPVQIGTADWKEVSVGWGGDTAFTCGVQSDDSLWCWGNDGAGELANGAVTGNQTSPYAAGDGGAWKKLAAATGYGEHVCGIQTDDSLWCWGSDYNGELGNGAVTGSQASPGAVSGGGTWIDISTGSHYSSGPLSCGIKTDGSAWCWGTDNNGQIGNGGPSGDRTTPTSVSGGGTWLQISVGGMHACGIQDDDTGWCWGNDDNGQLGNGATIGDQNSPVAIAGGYSWKQISAGVVYTCGIQTDDSLWCWGWVGGDSPTLVDAGPWKYVAAGGWAIHTCAIKSDDTLWCWGVDDSGQLGNGPVSGNQGSPYPVAGGYTWKTVSVGANISCGITSANKLMCWGSNLVGQLGIGDTDISANGALSDYCGAPAGGAGSLIYNSSSSIMQYCDGNGWVGIGK